MAILIYDSVFWYAKAVGMLMCKWSGLNKSYQSMVLFSIVFSYENNLFSEIEWGTIISVCRIFDEMKKKKSNFYIDCWSGSWHIVLSFLSHGTLLTKSIKSYPKSNFVFKTRETHLFFWDQNSKVISAPGMYETNVMVCLCMRNHLLLSKPENPYRVMTHPGPLGGLGRGWPHTGRER